MVYSLLTMGHSTHSAGRFLDLIRHFEVACVADVRTKPASSRFPHFNQRPLSNALKTSGIRYWWVGDALGGLPTDPAMFTEGRADYAKMSQAPTFLAGIDEIIERSAHTRLALLCSEHEPLECHRFLLIARELSERGIEIYHILRSGSIETQQEAEDRLLLLRRRAVAQCINRADQLNVAYRVQASRFSFRAPQVGCCA